jgi:hypothetical protein
MKKVFSIIGISFAGLFGLIILCSVLIIVFAPGLPVLVLAKIKIKSLDVRLDDFNSDYVLKNQEIMVNDYKFDIPDGCVKKGTETLWIYENGTTGYAALAFTDYSDVNLATAWNPNNKDEFAKYFGGTIPQNTYDFRKFQFSLNSDDFILSDAKQCSFCYLIAKMKDFDLKPLDRVYNYERDNIRGFIIEQESDHDKGLIAFQFYCTSNLSRQYQICFRKMTDRNLIYGTINSIQFVN